MKFTRWHVNVLTLSIILALIQGYLIWAVESNGGIEKYVEAKDAIGLGMILSPTGGIVWALRRAASDMTDRGD